MTSASGQAMPEGSFLDDPSLAATLLGEGLPVEAERHLQEASLAYHLEDVAETHLKEAQILAPDHAAVLIGLYRFYFYKGRLSDALAIANRCLVKAAKDNKLPGDWRQTKASDAIFDGYDDMLPRVFLFTLKGYAYLQMRLGNIVEGEAAIMKLLELDPSDKIGAKVLLDVLLRLELDDE
jgi:tetratricopeptide (TPR) repeat protein